MYARGDGVERDRRKALNWLAQSARQGNPKALKQVRVLLAENGRNNGAGTLFRR
jgi:TPR repeat protein